MSQRPLRTLCVKQLMGVTTNLIAPLIAFAVVGVISAAPAHAQSIDSFVGCLSSKASVADAVDCVPAPCYTTVTMSEESAQPACTLRDGTRLPRVIFSCAGPGGSTVLRFRPSFTLCSSSIDGVVPINHIELGEDVNSRHVQKMADIDGTSGFQGLTTIAVLDTFTPYNNKGCNECHDRLATLSDGTGNLINLFAPVRPAAAEGTIFTNDPSVQQPLVSPVPLSVICAGIGSSSQLHPNAARFALSVALCSKLDAKSQQQ